GQVHLLGDGPVTDADAASVAADYATKLAEAPVDIVCAGIGVNGHIAFNDPPVADFDDALAVKVVELDDVCRQQQVDDDCFPSFEAVPTHALTLTVPRLMDSARIFCIVPAAGKAPAVARTLAGPIEEACPASILRRHPNAKLYLDPDSASVAVADGTLSA
ncbi:MAG TPA: 6-phosphogluconolactonase, partial [Candidatus Avipropionibacterium avicola]|nr:6-phosphogluconolactonase [Candidatus Avipropionibacterium avicola]